MAALSTKSISFGSGLEAQLPGDAAEERTSEGKLGNTFSSYTCEIQLALVRWRALGRACAEKDILKAHAGIPRLSAQSHGIVRCPCVSPNHVHEVVPGHSEDCNKAPSVAAK